MERPDYHGGSIVNLMRSIERALGATPCEAAAAYPELNALPGRLLSGARNIVLLVIDGLGYRLPRRRGRGQRTASTPQGAPELGLPFDHRHCGKHFPDRRRPAAACAYGLAYLAARIGLPRGDAALSPALTAASRCRKAGIARAAYTRRSHVQPARGESHVYRRRTLSIPTTTSRIAGARCGGLTRNCQRCFQPRPKSCAAASERTFIHAYTYDLDAAAHNFGSASPEVQHKFRQIDAAFARFLEEIAGTAQW